MLVTKTVNFVFVYASQRGKKRKISVSNDMVVQSRAATCVGSNCLMQMLTSLAAKTKNGAPLKVGVVGKYRKVRSL